MSIKLTTETFIEKANIIHNNLYDYSLVDYVHSKAKVKIICPIHGSFEQTPSIHLSGSGCSICSYEAKATTAKSEFATKSAIVHNDKYSYELVDYKNNKTKVSISCPLHGSFQQKPNSHLNGKGCPICALSETGWSRTKFKDHCTKNNNGLGILYILECFNDNERFVKIGITSRSIKERYPNKTTMPYEYTVLHEITGDPEFIYDLETLLHRKSFNFKYIPNTYFAGSSTECFKSDTTYLGKLNTYLDFNITKQEEK